MNLYRWARAQWDRVGGWVLVSVGALAIVLGWNGVAGKAFTALQVPYIVSGGIGGLFMLGIGATLLLSSDLKDEWRKLDDLEKTVRDWEGRHGAGAAPVEDVPPPVPPPTKRSRTSRP